MFVIFKERESLFNDLEITFDAVLAKLHREVRVDSYPWEGHHQFLAKPSSIDIALEFHELLCRGSLAAIFLLEILINFILRQ